MHPAVVSGIVTDDVSVSYWPIISPFPITVPQVLAKVNLAQLLFSFSKVANVSQYSPPVSFVQP